MRALIQRRHSAKKLYKMGPVLSYFIPADLDMSEAQYYGPGKLPEGIVRVNEESGKEFIDEFIEKPLTHSIIKEIVRKHIPQLAN